MNRQWRIFFSSSKEKLHNEIRRFGVTGKSRARISFFCFFAKLKVALSQFYSTKMYKKKHTLFYLCFSIKNSYSWGWRVMKVSLVVPNAHELFYLTPPQHFVFMIPDNIQKISTSLLTMSMGNRTWYVNCVTIEKHGLLSIEFSLRRDYYLFSLFCRTFLGSI